jgi:glycosyltransferase involved in cell wall biosynthesis
MSAARASASESALHVILPNDIDDPRTPSGGNVYDRRICRGLAASGWAVHEHAIRGAWPRPGMTERTKLARVLATLPDNAIVLLDGLVASNVPDVLKAQARRLRMVVLAHMPLGDETADLRYQEREALSVAVAVVTTSFWSRRRLLDLYALSADRVYVAPPGVDAAPLVPGSAAGSELLCVGAVTPRKGHDLLVEALATVSRARQTNNDAMRRARETNNDAMRRARETNNDAMRRTRETNNDAMRRARETDNDAMGRACETRDAALPDVPWSCTCVGALDRDPDFVDRLRRQTRAYGIADRVRFVGPCTGPNLDTRYAAADLLVLASRGETYGMVVTEALAHGTPVLATATNGLPEALGRAPDGSLPGILVQPDDPAALAGALRRWLGESDLRRQLRRSACGRRTTLTSWAITSKLISSALSGIANVSAGR